MGGWRLVAVLVATLGVVGASGFQVTRDPVVRVSTLADLLPKTPVENALAIYFDRSGEPLAGRIFEETLAHPSEVLDLDGGSPQEKQRRRIRLSVCTSAAVVVGVPAQGRPVLNRSRTSLFTVHDFRVRQWIRPVTGPATITVAKGGGAVEITSTHEAFSLGSGESPLRTGSTMVAYLNAAGSTGAYLPYDPPVVLEGTGSASGAMPAYQFRDYVREATELARTCS